MITKAQTNWWTQLTPPSIKHGSSRKYLPGNPITYHNPIPKWKQIQMKIVENSHFPNRTQWFNNYCTHLVWCMLPSIIYIYIYITTSFARSVGVTVDHEEILAVSTFGGSIGTMRNVGVGTINFQTLVGERIPAHWSYYCSLNCCPFAKPCYSWGS